MLKTWRRWTVRDIALAVVHADSSALLLVSIRLDLDRMRFLKQPQLLANTLTPVADSAPGPVGSLGPSSAHSCCPR